MKLIKTIVLRIQRRLNDKIVLLIELSLCLFFFIFALFKLFPIKGYTILADYRAYMVGSAPYLPSFSLLNPIIENLQIYITFLIICSILSLLLLIKLEEYSFVFIILLFQLIGRVICANIDPFVFLIICICLCYKDNNYIPPILMAFVCFKPSVFLVIPCLIYLSKNKVIFILLFSLCIGLFNIQYVLNPNIFFEFIDNSITSHSDIRTYTRFYFSYCYFFIIREYIKSRVLQS